MRDGVREAFQFGILGFEFFDECLTVCQVFLQRIV